MLGLSPEQLIKQSYIEPDFSLTHPKSVTARLQRYILLSYPNEKDFSRGKEALEKNPNIISIIENTKGGFLSIPDDPFFQDLDQFQWGMYSLNLPAAWNKTTGHAYLGVPDSGLDINVSTPSLSHPDLTNFRLQFSDSFNSSNIQPSYHGTHVTGIIAATTDNNEGVAGICWDCAISFAQVSGAYSTKVSAYDFLSDVGVQAINSSWRISAFNPDGAALCFPPVGGSPNNNAQPFCDALEEITNRDIIISAAAGNGAGDGSAPPSSYPKRDDAIGSSTFIDFPAVDPRTIAVGATQFNNTRADFSDHGPELDLLAPGFDIHSTMLRDFDGEPDWWLCGDDFGPGLGFDGYGNCSGTSMSAPHITGILGLMRSTDPLLNIADIKAALFSSADHYPAKVAGVGHGIPDAEEAIDNVLGVVNGSIVTNRLTPLFSLYSNTGEDSLYTTVPQMAWSAFAGTLPPQPFSPVTYQSAYGSPTPNYSKFPHDETGNPPQPQPLAEVYIFTTKHNPIIPHQDLVPLFRMSYQGVNGSNGLNTDHVYTTEQAGITAYEGVGYKLDGMEGYIFSNQNPQPVGTEKLHRRYNFARDDHAIFPESKLSAMNAAGYTYIEGNNAFIGYVYLNENADNDLLVDGYERAIGTCINDSDTDNDGISDGEEVLNYPRTDPVDVVTACGNTAQPEYTWKNNATGTVITNIPWNYAMGYHFTPQVDGTIDQLGGFFNGTKLVKLFNKNTGTLLAQTSVSANNNWSYGSISPMSVQAGTQYTVAVYLNGSGASYRYVGSNFFPETYDSIKINGSTYAYTGYNPNIRPTNNIVSYMFGQADIRFTPN